MDDDFGVPGVVPALQEEEIQANELDVEEADILAIAADIEQNAKFRFASRAPRVGPRKIGVIIYAHGGGQGVLGVTKHDVAVRAAQIFGPDWRNSIKVNDED